MAIYTFDSRAETSNNFNNQLIITLIGNQIFYFFLNHPKINAFAWDIQTILWNIINVNLHHVCRVDQQVFSNTCSSFILKYKKQQQSRYRLRHIKWLYQQAVETWTREVDWCSRTHSHYPCLSKTHSDTLELLFFNLFTCSLCIGVQECQHDHTHARGSDWLYSSKSTFSLQNQVAYSPNPLFDVYVKTGIFQPQMVFLSWRVCDHKIIH